MKACVLNNINDIVYSEVKNPEFDRDDQVMVKMKACGICSSDIDRVLKSGAYHYPLILGHEMSGQIIDVADQKNKELIGKKAVIFPLLPCKKCSSCEQGFYAQCSNYDYFGSRRDGGYAQFLSVPLWNIKTFSDDIDYEAAACTEPLAVAWHAFSKAKVENSSDILIVGTGIIGIAIGFWAKKFGHNVTFVTQNEKKKNYLIKLGFESIVDEVSEKAFDVCFECVGTEKSLHDAIFGVKPRGKVILVGNPKGDMLLEKNIYWKILRLEAEVVGVWNSVYPSDWDFVLNNLKTIPVQQLITHRFALSQVKEAFRCMSDKNEFKIKGVFVID